LTGAPLLLLELLRWLVSNSSVSGTSLLLRRGELAAAYTALQPTIFHDDLCLRLNQGLVRSAWRRLTGARVRRPDLRRLFPSSDFDCVYANTLASSATAMELVGDGRPLIHHVHELSSVAEFYSAAATLRTLVPHTTAYIVPSRAVEAYLVCDFGVPSSRIHIIPEFPITQPLPREARNVARATLRRELGIPENVRVIGMCGLPQWRKGSDLFVQLARELAHRTPDCYCVWFGGDIQNWATALYDIAKLGLGERCRFLPASRDPAQFYATCDVFALTSREDPFPVVMLEAAAAGLPVICFANSGGAPEFVRDDAGVVVPYADVSAMAEACVQLAGEPGRRTQLAETGRARVATDCSLASVGPRIRDVIEQVNADIGP
jgi:glycosyltransferase involved in cell wall biosynthesis